MAELSSRASYDDWRDLHEVDREADAPWHGLVLHGRRPVADVTAGCSE
jgi:hypothetical protein